MRILLIEDETPLRVAVTDALTDEGYRVIAAVDGRDGFEKAIAEKPDLIVLDIMLPKMDGYELCRELRRLGHRMPVLMLTARGLVEDRVHGLDAGADDYLIKPFSLAELKARIRALRRRSQDEAGQPERAAFGDVQVDLTRRTVTRRGREVALTVKEYGVLALLIQYAGQAVSREQFLDLVWGHAAFPTTRTVDNHVGRLRTKLEPNPAAPRYILTLPKSGYRLVLDGTQSKA
ncbi:MAG TPA: response regulator transcription factor [Verrucomicrobiales bacterium]|jgi:DNA-binding response OmpR family regulator|nr:response regulator transcription factor [Verrucomicrobiales bacterium]